jgi:hypothetical protein
MVIVTVIAVQIALTLWLVGMLSRKSMPARVGGIAAD